jgi:hypothetical protein
VLLRDLGITLDEPQQAMAAIDTVRATLVGLTSPADLASDAVGRTGNFGSDTWCATSSGWTRPAAAWPLPSNPSQACAWPSASATRRPRAPT